MNLNALTLSGWLLVASLGCVLAVWVGRKGTPSVRGALHFSALGAAPSMVVMTGFVAHVYLSSDIFRVLEAPTMLVGFLSIFFGPISFIKSLTLVSLRSGTSWINIARLSFLLSWAIGVFTTSMEVITA